MRLLRSTCAVLLPLVLARFGSALRLSAAAPEKAPKNVRIVTFDDKGNWRTAYLLLSAAKVGLPVTLLGRENAEKVHWGKNMGLRTKTLRDFVLDQNREDRLKEDEIALFVDAYDVTVLAGPDELAAKLTALEQKFPGKGVFFNAEDRCDPEGPWCEKEAEDAANNLVPGVHWENEPKGVSPLKYLNAGAFVGRTTNLRKMFARFEIPQNGSKREQPMVHAQLIGPNSDIMQLVRDCDLFQSGFFAWEEELKIVVENGRVRNLDGGMCPEGSKPAVLHFNGVSHWALNVKVGDDMKVAKARAIEQLEHRDWLGGLNAIKDGIVKSADEMQGGMSSSAHNPLATTFQHEYFRKLFPAEGEFLDPFGHMSMLGRQKTCADCKNGNKPSVEFCDALGWTCSDQAGEHGEASPEAIREHLQDQSFMNEITTDFETHEKVFRGMINVDGIMNAIR